MNETLTLILEIIFWFALFMVFYTYLGYGIVLYALVKLKELFVKPVKYSLPASNDELPEVTLFITAFNEEDVVDEKMENSLELDYPADKLRLVWITDGSNDNTNERLKEYPEVTVLYQPRRQGKTAALNRALPYVKTPYVIFTDANTMLNKGAIKEIIRQFSDPRVGCVAGEKRVEIQAEQGATAGEGIYWKYESALKRLDYRLYSAVGAAGELFAIRTSLFEQMPPDTLLDDFIEGAALFSDIFAASGMRIVLSGTDSLGFLFTEDEQLYDRCILLHTTFIPYREFESVLGIHGIDEYIRYGGTMSLGGVHYNESSTFASKERADEYV